MTLRLSRAYEPVHADDGYRLLVDRVWPRGRTRDELQLDEWARDLAPSAALRKWFGHDPERWDEFVGRYERELAHPERRTRLDGLADRARHGTLTVVYGARDEQHNQAVVIAREIEKRLNPHESAP